MSTRATRRRTHDPRIEAQPVEPMWVLLQTAPSLAVLACSENRGRLVSEMAELYGCDQDKGFTRDLRFGIFPTNPLPDLVPSASLAASSK